MKLENKSVLITGGGRGLGRAMALAMAREGAGVTVMSRSLEELEAVADQIRTGGGNCLVSRGDVSKSEDVTRTVKQAVDRFSTVDVLVNNAAIIGPVRLREDADLKAWQKTIAVNLNGPCLCCRSVLPFMIQNGGGRIINISSGLGEMPFPRFCAYSVSKAGIIQLTRSLSEEFPPFNIRVNAIDPGVMDTRMQEQIRSFGPEVLGKSVYKNFLEYKDKGGLKNPDEVASLAVVLASPESDRINGFNGTLSEYARMGYNA
ncbi:MAG: SDR family oxidoreductase [Deltaproteobacteria bacterium]|nr:SDR family oxidoreductase [Deltaproteobacteria bacterium]